MAAKQMKFETDARSEIATGLSQLARAVKATLGPRGRNVILQKSFGSPRITKDGVTVAKEIELPQPFENMGAKLVQTVASKTGDVAGDGTTTAVVLAEAIYSEGLKYVTAGGHNPVIIQRGILKAAEAAGEAITGLSKKVKGREDYKRVATISANGDEHIGDLMADAMEKVGKEGVITVDEGKSTESTLEYTEGMQFDKGYLSPYFLTNPTTLEAVLENAYILLHEKKINNLAELLPLLNKIVTSGRPLLIIAEDVEAEALAALVVNKLRGVLQVCAVKAPGFGDRREAMLAALAVSAGGEFVSEDIGLKLENVEIEQLGQAKRIVVDNDKTLLVQGAGKRQARNDEKLGFDILATALRSPARQIADNAGEDGEVIVDQILENKSVSFGYNAAAGEFVDMFKAGIIDPTKVARTALLNAASVSGLALTTEVLITELKEKKDESNAVAGAVV